MVRRNFTKGTKPDTRNSDLHLKSCPPTVGTWKLSVGSNPADRGCAEQSGTIRPPGLAENLECDSNEGGTRLVATSE